jgi:Ca-activated chloride channel family protein
MKFEPGIYFVFIFSIPIFLILIIYFYKKNIKDLKLLFNKEEAAFNRFICNISYKKIFLKKFFLFLSIVFFSIAILRPQFGLKFQKIKQRGRDIVFLLDVSTSMLSADIKPNRLSKAKYEIKKFIDKYLKTDRVGFIPFAGQAFIQCPLTFDYNALKLMLDSVNVNSISLQGTNLGAAFETVVNAFEETSTSNKILILLTDGEDHNEETLDILKKLKNKKIKVYAIGIGSPQGAPITLNNGEFVKNESGNIVTSKLGESLLKQIASLSEGAYFRLDSNSNEKALSIIFEEIMKLQKSELGVKSIALYEEQYQVFLLLGFIFLIMETMILGKKKNENV